MLFIFYFEENFFEIDLGQKIAVVKENCGNQAFPEMPGVSTTA